MRFLVVGLGSMGKRRVRNLKHLQVEDIIGYDVREDRREEAQKKYGIKTFGDFDQAMAQEPDALIISTPPDLHMKYAIIAAKNSKHFFTEASVVDDGIDELIEECRERKTVAAPSCTMIFYPAIRKIKELIKSGHIGRPLTFTYHSGQYLPDWHPWEDYRKFYVGKRETGGAREIVPFESVWLNWVFGSVNTISCFKDKLSNLDVDIDDVYQILLKFDSGVFGHVLIDVVARAPYRVLRLLGEDGVIEWNWNLKTIRVFNAKDKRWTDFPVEEGVPEDGYVVGEKMYIDEMNTFLNAVKGKSVYPYTFEEDKRILSLLYAAERSSDQGKHVKLE